MSKNLSTAHIAVAAVHPCYNTPMKAILVLWYRPNVIWYDIWYVYFLNSISCTSYNNLIIIFYFIKYNYVWNFGDRCSVHELSSQRPQDKVNIKITCKYWWLQQWAGFKCQVVARQIRTPGWERRETRIWNYRNQLNIISADIVYSRNLHISLNQSRMLRYDFTFEMSLWIVIRDNANPLISYTRKMIKR